MRLHVILRTSSDSLLTPTNLTRICGSHRELLLRKCLVSLVSAIKQSVHDIHLTVLDDHSTHGFLDFLHTTAEHVHMTLIQLKQRGANHSAYEQFLMARNSEGLVYVVEDDYLHEPHAIDHMVGAYVHFMNRYNQPVVIYPYDCSLRYQPHAETETTLYHDGMRYWRTVDKTANTMLTHYSTFAHNWHEFETLALNYPQVQEDHTINKLYWSNKNPLGTVRVFNPIPSVAYHVGYSMPTHINTTHMKWQDLWSQIPNWSLIQGWFYHPEFYQHMVHMLPDHSKIVEVGSWRGRSTTCLASMVKQSGKDIKIYAVDTWQGSPQEPTHQQLIDQLPGTLYDDFIANLVMCDVQELVTPLQMHSQQASHKFDPASVEFVMIDGAHDYESVKLDIMCWRSKIKPGGIMAGDDYDKSWPGVIQAVHEQFDTRVNTAGSLWWVQL